MIKEATALPSMVLDCMDASPRTGLCARALCTFPEGNPIPDQFDQTETHWQMVHTASGITKSKSSAGRRHLGKCYVSKVSKV